MIKLQVTRVGTHLADRAHARAATQQVVRRHELDWLRSFAVFGLIPFHAAIVFTTGSGDYVKNSETSQAIDTLVSFIAPWGMPLIFLVGGASACFALRSRRPRAYVTERLSRLVVPFIFGMLVIVPLQMYIGQVYRLGRAPPFIPFYAGHVVELLRIPTGAVPQNSADWIGHLWFIPILVVFALLAMPFDWLLHRHYSKRALAALTMRHTSLGYLLLFGLPLGVALLLFQASASWTPALRPLANWSLFAMFLFFFLSGYLIYNDLAFTRRMRTAAPYALVMAIVSLAALEAVDRTHSAPSAAFTPPFVLYCFLRGYVSWFWVAALLGYGMRFLAFSPRWLPYITEAAYPAYIIHMPILSLIALSVVGWQAPLVIKLVIIIITTFAVVLCVYDLAIKRIPALRFLFGLKALRHRAPLDTPLLDISPQILQTPSGSALFPVRQTP